MKRFFATLVLFALATLAGAQTVTVPNATSYKVVLAWTAPTGCTTAAPCTYAVYRVPGTVTLSGGLTGATLVTTTAAQAVTASDTTVVPGQTYSYALETLQGGANSAPSATVTVTIPFVPAAPSGLTGSAG